MKKLHKFLLKSFFGPFVATFLIALFILILQFLWLKIDEIAGKGLEWHVVAELLLYASAGLVPMALPLAVLLSSIMTFGNLGENFELTAIKSSGIPLQRFMRPLTLLTAILTVGAFFYANHVIPYANLKAMTLLHDIKKQREELQIREGIFYSDIDGYSIKINEKNQQTNLLKDIMIYDHSSRKGNNQVTVADSGYIRMTDDATKLLITLYHGQTYHELDEPSTSRRRSDESTYPHRIHRFDEQNMLVDIKGFHFTRTDESLFKDSYQMLNIYKLRENSDSLKKEYNSRAYKFSQDIQKNTFVKKRALENQRKIYAKRTGKQGENKAPGKNPGQKPKEVEEKIINIDSVRRAMGDTVSSPSDTLSSEEKQAARVLDTLPNGKFVFHLDSYIDTLQPGKMRSILKTALVYARRNSKEISNSKRSFEYRQKKIYKHQIEFHKKFTLSFACIIFFFIGAPLGSIIRKGGLGTPLVISVLLFIVYYIISMTGENFAEKGVMPAYIGMWISSAIFLPAGIFLTYKATNDSVILNPDTYIKSIKRIITLHFKKAESEESERDSEKTEADEFSSS